MSAFALPQSAYGMGTAAMQPGFMNGWQMPGAQVMNPTQPLSIMPTGANIPSLPMMGGKSTVAPSFLDRMGAWGKGNGLGLNLATGQLALSAAGTIGNLLMANQQNKLAKKQFAFQKEFANTNLSNQIKSYNTALEDRARSRAVVEGQTDAQRDSYIDRNRATRGG